MKNLLTIALGMFILAFAPTVALSQGDPQGGMELYEYLIANENGDQYSAQPFVYYWVDESTIVTSKGLAVWDEDIGLYQTVALFTATGRPASVDGKIYLPAAINDMATLLVYEEGVGLIALMELDGSIRGVEHLGGGLLAVYGSLFSVITEDEEIAIPSHLILLRTDTDNPALLPTLPIQPGQGGIEEFLYTGNRTAELFFTPEGAGTPYQALFNFDWTEGWNETSMTSFGPEFYSIVTSEEEFKIHPGGSKTVTGKMSPELGYSNSLAYCPPGEDVWVLSNIHTGVDMSAVTVFNETVYVGLSDNLSWLNGEVLTEPFGPIMAIPLESFSSPQAIISVYTEVFGINEPSNPNIKGLIATSNGFTIIGNNLFGDGFNASSIGTWGPIETVTTETVLVKDTFSIYPNPASDWVKIDGNIENIEIFNYLGQMVQVIKQNTFSVQDFPAGNYILQIATPEGVVSEKLTVIR